MGIDFSGHYRPSVARMGTFKVLALAGSVNEMSPEARWCLDTAAQMLINATGCQPSVAWQIVESIALGAIRWGQDGSSQTPGHPG